MVIESDGKIPSGGNYSLRSSSETTAEARAPAAEATGSDIRVTSFQRNGIGN